MFRAINLNGKIKRSYSYILYIPCDVLVSRRILSSQRMDSDSLNTIIPNGMYLHIHGNNMEDMV